MNATPASAPARPARSRLWRRWGLLGLTAIVLAGGTYAYAVVVPKMRPVAQVASGYMARVTCACHFVGKRSLESCMTDKEPGMEQVRVSVDPATRRVTAGIPLVATATATHTPGLGCVLDR